eukprot:15160114-Alexandrium_andersonii.AAC.1
MVPRTAPDQAERPGGEGPDAGDVGAVAEEHASSICNAPPLPAPDRLVRGEKPMGAPDDVPTERPDVGQA